MKYDTYLPRILLGGILGLTMALPLYAEELETNASTTHTAQEGSPAGARLRLFGQNGIGMTLYPGSSCIGGDSIKISGGLSDALSSLIGAASNEAIGIPETITTRTIANQDGLLSTAYFKELAVNATPVAISASFIGTPMVAPPGAVIAWRTSSGSRPIEVSFTPTQGTDYEILLAVSNGGTGLIVNEIMPTGELKPIPVQRAARCP